MLKTAKIEKRIICRFIAWCLFIFCITFLNYSGVMYGASSSQKAESGNSIGQILNAFIGIFVSDAWADDEEDVITINDVISSGDIVNSGNTGAFPYSYSLEVPTGRGGLTPKLSLNYSSGGPNGILGVGWDMTMSYIQRETKFGKPDYTENDQFVMKYMDSNFELIYDEILSEYRVKNEGAFLKIERDSSNNNWTVTDRNGTTYTFGTSDDSRLIPYTGCTSPYANCTFRWYLKTITDLNNNTITYTYINDTANNQVYPSTIDYNVNYHVKFVYPTTARTDTEPTYRNYFLSKTNKLLREIWVCHGSDASITNLIRAYRLNYVYGASSRSILYEIKVYGSGSTLGSHGLIDPDPEHSPSLPPTSFSLDEANYNFGNRTYWNDSIPIDSSNYTRGYYSTNTGDFNGDGRSDIMYLDSAGPVVMLSNGATGFSKSYWGGAIPDSHVYSRLGDFNGDGKTDYYYWYDEGSYEVMNMALSNGSTFVNSWYYNTYYDSNMFYEGHHVGDVNGDGMSDLILVKHNNTNNTYRIYVMLSNGSGFEGPYLWSDGNSFPPFPKAVADFNGDGKSDLISFMTDTAGASIYINYSTGTGFIASAPVPTSQSHIIGYDWWRIGDFNGDGKSDLSFLMTTGYYVMISNGTTLEPPVKWQDYVYVPCPYALTATDVNGDGKSDYIYHGTDNNWKVMLSNGSGFKYPDDWVTTVDWSYLLRCFFADFTGDGQIDILDFNTVGTYPEDVYIYVAENNANFDNVNKVTDGLGATTEIVYAPSSAWTNTYLPFKVETVYSITKKDGNSAHTVQEVRYYGEGFYDSIEREFRGFGWVSSWNDATEFTTVSYFHQDAVFKGKLDYSQTKDKETELINSIQNSWEAVVLEDDIITVGPFTPDDETEISDNQDFRTFVRLADSTVFNYNEDSDFVSSVTTEYTYDRFGNIETKNEETSDGIKRLTTTVYDPDISRWNLGKPTSIVIKNPENIHERRETTMEYTDVNKPWLLKEKISVLYDENLLPIAEYTTTYGYDNYGNITSIQDPDTDHYPVTYNYDDSDGMFPNITTYKLSQEPLVQHIIEREYDSGFGTILTETNQNGQITEYDYDEFGKVDYIDYPDGSFTDYTYHIEEDNHYTIVESSAQPTVTTYYDNFGRNKKVKTVATDGTIIFTETLYDNAGNVSKKYLPYYSSTQPCNRYSTIYTYDPVRWYLSQQTNPDGTHKSFTVNGLTETVTDENNYTKTIVKDSLGRIIEITEATGGLTEYTYDIFDNLLTVTDPLENFTEIKYDDLGRKISMEDPYMGNWGYEYDENGNLTSQTDGKGQTTTMTYDGLNRIETKTYNCENPVRVIEYVYDEEREGYFNEGLLTTVTSTGTAIVYNYDNMGRLANEKRTIDSVDYEIDREYDLAGRLDYITYPADGPEIDYSYHPIGFLSQVDKVDSVTTMLAQYAMDDYNALGQAGYVLYGNEAETSYTYYDGNYRLKTLVTYDSQGAPIQELEYTFDNVGNLETIEDDLIDVTQSFGYDEVNRLTSADASGGSDPSRIYSQTFTYDLAGNIEEKTGIGGFSVMEWQDPLTHIKPKAVNFDEEVTGVAQRNIIYNQDNMPTQISYNGDIDHPFELFYDGEGNRIKKVKRIDEDTTERLAIYVGDIYEIRGEGEAEIEISYIYANGQKIVTLTGSHEYYTHSDHLGSTNITTDEYGVAIEEIGYLPFGAELFRNVYNNGEWISVYKFTGQEHDSEYELYNYNARLYDPVMGRFITPDTIVPDPYNPQSLNRYSYCINNPMIYVDPTGHGWKCDGNGQNCQWEEETLETVEICGNCEEDNNNDNDAYFDQQNLLNDIRKMEQLILWENSNFNSPEGEVRFYGREAFGSDSAVHVYVFGVTTGMMRGRSKNGNNGGGYPANDPFLIIDTNGQNETVFMKKVIEYYNREYQSFAWYKPNTWFLPWINDCHSTAKRAIISAGGTYFSWPTGRVNIDDNIKASPNNPINVFYGFIQNFVSTVLSTK